MKRVVPYIIISLVVLALGALLVSSTKNLPRKLDERISLRQKDKIPYGFYAARSLVPSLFPNAGVYSDKNAPGFWDSLSHTDSAQAVILVAGTLNADEEELARLFEFVKAGNHVFIITKYMSYEANRFFGFGSADISSEDGLFAEGGDSLLVGLDEPRFSQASKYVYPGKRFATYYNYINKDQVTVLGTNETGHPNFIQLQAGKGYFYIHTAPLAFSNYFVLHKQNVGYLEKAFSVIPPTVTRVAWSEYYLTKQSKQQDNEPNWLGVLFQYPAFKWALLTAIFALLVYVLMESRRKQRLIPVHQKPGNDSLDFVQTIGRLYYDQKDHTDLARKMSVYFLDHVRSRFKLPTHSLDASFVNALHVKSGYPVNEIKEIVAFITFIQEQGAVSEHQLTQFHNQLELFYQNT